MSLQRSHGWRWLLVLGIVWGAANLYCQTPKFQDTIWEGKLAVKLPELARYVYGVKESSMKRVQLVNLPVEIWFPSETTFSVIYVLNPAHEIKNGERVGHKYFWAIGELVPPSAETRAKFFGEGLVDKARKTLLGKFGADVNKFSETLTITGMANLLYQRVDLEHARYLLDPRPATVTCAGVFTKTDRLVSVERLKTGEEGFGEKDRLARLSSSSTLLGPVP
ncbi:MAG: hypothetical protein EBT07_13695 [Actinobacteria bacterium]|nr:hypothetical protein [Actinomycetota bacterium]